MSPKWMDFFQVSFLKLPNPFSQSETIIMSSFTYNVMIQSFGDPEMFDPDIRFTYIYKYHSGWWFQRIWKILVKLDHFPKRDEHKKIFETTT